VVGVLKEEASIAEFLLKSWSLSQG